MGKLKIEIDIIAAKFIATAILYQKEGGVIFENDTDDSEFSECYGFSRKQLKKFLENLRKQIPINKSTRKRMFEGDFLDAQITVNKL